MPKLQQTGATQVAAEREQHNDQAAMFTLQKSSQDPDSEKQSCDNFEGVG